MYVCIVYVEFGDKQESGVNYVIRLKASLKANALHSLSMNIIRGPKAHSWRSKHSGGRSDAKKECPSGEEGREKETQR